MLFTGGANGTGGEDGIWGPPSATPSQVFIDPNAESANDRFKTQGEFVIGVSSPAFTGYTRKCFVMLASPDGLHWHLYKGQNLTSAFEAATSPKSPHTVSCWVPGSIDTQTNILFDPASQRYHMYLRGRRGPAVGGGTVDRSTDTRLGTYRSHRRLTSSNESILWGEDVHAHQGIGWVDAKTVLDVDAVDNETHSVNRNRSATAQKIPPSDFYGFTPWKVPGTGPDFLLGFAMKFWHWGLGPCRAYDPADKAPNFCGPGTYSVHLMASYDGGSTWAYIGGRRAVLGTGLDGTFASRHVWIGPTPAVVGDELFVFFGGTNIPEGSNATCGKTLTCVDPASPGGKQQSGMGLITTRIDGLSSATVGYAEVGELVTRPINITAERRLQLNADCGGHGALHVELLSADGVALPCYGLAQSMPFWSNAVAATMRWSGEGGVACEGARQGTIAAGQQLQVRFVIEDCDLFSMRLV